MKIGFLSDAHGHVRAFLKGLEVLNEKKVDQIVFLGDALGYIPDTGVLDEIDRIGIQAIKGNHEAAILSDELKNNEEILRHNEIKSKLSTKQLFQIKSWPIELYMEKGSLLAVHGSPDAPLNGYLYPDTDLEGIKVPEGVRVVVSGHTHRPCIRESSGVLFVNVGSCGLPRDQGDQGSVAIVSTGTLHAEIIRYSIENETVACLEHFLSLSETVKSIFKRRASRE